MYRFKILFFIAFLFIPIQKAASQHVTLSPQAEVSVLTCGSGNELYSLYGHTAIRIADPVAHMDVVYNYGAFDFRTPNFVLKFTKGDLQYFVATSSFDEFLYAYNYDQRSVYEQVLALAPEQKQQLLDQLNATLLSDNRFYTYKFIDRNCTSMVVDMLNSVLPKGTIHKIMEEPEVTYRDILFPYFKHHFYEQLGTSLIFGKKVDETADKIFLPEELWKSINTVKYNGQPLLEKRKTWLEFPAPDPRFSWWNNVYSYLLILVVLVAANNNRLNMVYFTLVSLLGIFFSISGWYSFHGELAWNYNVLLINPLLLLLVYFYIRKQAKKVYLTAIVCLALLAAYLLVIVSKVYLLIVLPLVFTHFILLGRFVMRYRKNQRLYRSTTA